METLEELRKEFKEKFTALKWNSQTGNDERIMRNLNADILFDWFASKPPKEQVGFPNISKNGYLKILESQLYDSSKVYHAPDVMILARNMADFFCSKPQLASDAVEFAAWMLENRFEPNVDDEENWLSFIHLGGAIDYTTEQLYELFLKETTK